MDRKKIEKMKEIANNLGYTYTTELIDKIYNAYIIEENTEIKDLLEELLDYVYNF